MSLVKAQNPEVPLGINLVEIDRAIFDLQLKLNMNLAWLTHDYGRCYRHIKKRDRNGSDFSIYVPEIYIGKQNGNPSYYTVTPDNDKKGTCFFVVGNENYKDYQQHHQNYLSYDVGIVFWVNLEKIDSQLLQTELFTQSLIKEVRDVLTFKLGGAPYNLQIKSVTRNWNEIYKEFSLPEEERYLMAPYQGFRFNIGLNLFEECQTQIDSCSVIAQNLSQLEIANCIIPGLNFNDDLMFNALSEEQKNVLKNRLA